VNETKTSDIPSYIEKGREVSGMQTFDQHLGELASRELITLETALAYASNPNDFQRNLSFQSSSSTLIETDGLLAATAQEENSLVMESTETPNIDPQAHAQAFPQKPAPLPPGARTSTKLTGLGAKPVVPPKIPKPGAA